MLGKDLLIASNGRVIAAQRTCSLNMQQDTIEVCSPVSGPWREYIPSTLGWDISCDGLIYAPEYADELMEVLTSRKKVRLSYYDPELRIVRSGYAIPTGLQQGASISDLANYSLTFQGSGELGKVDMTTIEPTAEDMVQNVSMGEDENHAYAYSAGKVIRVAKFEVTTPSRLYVAMGRGQVVLYKSDENAEEGGMLHLMNRIRGYENLRLYAEYELGHFSYARNNNASYILAPGVYYYAMDTTYKTWISMSLLSLPTE